MATRFYFSSVTVAPVSPAFAAWDHTSSGIRRQMTVDPDGSTATASFAGGGNPQPVNATVLIQQLVSEQMIAGVSFSTSDTIKAQVFCVEALNSSNIERAPICVKVYSRDGSTLRATLKALGHYGPTTSEWTTFGHNTTVADGDTLGANYTTVDGDRLVVELGGQVSATNAGTSVFAGQYDGAVIGGTDFAEEETDLLNFHRPWFEISTAITFFTPGPPAFSTNALSFG